MNLRSYLYVKPYFPSLNIEPIFKSARSICGKKSLKILTCRINFLFCSIALENISDHRDTYNSPLSFVQTKVGMHSSSGLPGENESLATQPPSEREAVNSANSDGKAKDEGEDIEPPLAKRAKVENGAAEISGLISTTDPSPSGNPEPSKNDNVGRDDNDQNVGENNVHLDSEELNYEEEEATSDDEELFQQILALARAGRIPLEYLAARGIHVELDDDDEDVEYPFDQPPKSIDDVADFIRSEKCQRIMVLAG